MKQGFIKVAAVTVDIRVADVWHNCKEICKRMKEAEKAAQRSCFSGALPDRVYLQRSFYTGYTVKRGAQSTCKSCRRDQAYRSTVLLGFHLQLMESL